MPLSSIAFLPSLRQTLLDRPDLRVVVTGGRGWIGRACLEMLDEVLGDTISQRVSVFGASAGAIVLSSGRHLMTRPLAALAEVADGPLLLAHFAFLTKDKVADRPLAAFVEGNREISDVIDAAVRRLRPIGLIMPSSGAATQLSGGFDSNPYGAMKRADEDRFAMTTADVAARYSCPRLFNLAGPFINKVESYVLACIIRDVQAGVPIRLRADKPVIRSYVHVRDLLNVCFADCLLGTQDAEPVFETAGEVEVEVGELAKRVAETLGARDHAIERPAMDAAKLADRYVGDPTHWRRRLAAHQIDAADLTSQILDTAAYLAEGSVG